MDRFWRAVDACKDRLRAGWSAWEAPGKLGLMWARYRDWNGSPVLERAPMTDDERAVVDIVLQQEEDTDGDQPGQ